MFYRFYRWLKAMLFDDPEDAIRWLLRESDEDIKENNHVAR